MARSLGVLLGTADHGSMRECPISQNMELDPLDTTKCRKKNNITQIQTRGIYHRSSPASTLINGNFAISRETQGLRSRSVTG